LNLNMRCFAVGPFHADKQVERLLAKANNQFCSGGETMIRIVCGIAMAMFLSACGTLTAPQPNPVFVDQIDAYFGKAKNETYTSSGVFTKPIPYSAGQFVVMGMTSPTEKNVSKISIVGKEQGGWILETYSLTPTAEGISQMLIVGLEAVAKTGSMKDIDIVWVKMKNNDQPVQKLDGVMLNMVEGFIQSSISDLVVRTQTTPEDGGTVKTLAGIFQGTTKTRGEVSFLGKKYASDSWMHPAVPINGMVKSVTAEEGQTIELLDFGLSGAKRSF